MTDERHVDAVRVYRPHQRTDCAAMGGTDSDWSSNHTDAMHPKYSSKFVNPYGRGWSPCNA